MNNVKRNIRIVFRQMNFKLKCKNSSKGFAQRWMGYELLAHPQFFVLVGVQGGGIWIIRLGGCLSFHETPPHVPQAEA